jgi:ATP-independent RNA helicase DbpA
MVQNLTSLGYEHMTPIQEKSLPITLSGKDLIAKAKTGSGKTAAFGITLIEKLRVKRFRIQSMVLCPTRELADQVAKELRQIAKCRHNIKITTLCGGVAYKPQVHSLSHQAHIIVGTPGRILKHLEDESFSTDEIDTLVLDEADRMLDMGFYEDINSIIDFIPKKRQTLLFSATYPDNIRILSDDIMTNPTTVEVESQHTQSVIKQSFYEAKKDSRKDDITLKILDQHRPKSTIIFCNTKVECDRLADTLEEYGQQLLVLHSDFEQQQRRETLLLFANRSYPILIATDVAARGLDIDDVELVINYDLPNDMEVYTHRVGRTARAGKSGEAISLLSGSDTILFEELKEYMGIEFKSKVMSDTKVSKNFSIQSEYKSFYISGGKRQKIRAGDILGALTVAVGLDKNDVGKIDILETCSYVAIKRASYDKAFYGIQKGKIKGKDFRVYKR